MPTNPYANGGGFIADEFNGLHGAYSPDAIMNQLLMKSKPSDNPYDSMLDHSTDFKPPKTNTVPFDPAGRRRSVGPAPPPADPNQFGIGGGFTPAVTPPPAQTPVPPVTLQQWGQSPTGNVDAATWADANRYVTEAKAKGWDYSYLLQQPQLITEFRNWAIANNAQSVDIVDYLAARHLPSPGARRSGSDTFAAWQAQQGGQIQTTTTNTTGGGQSLADLVKKHSTDTRTGTGTGNTGTGVSTGTGTGAPPLQPGTDYLANLDRALQASQQNEWQNSLRQFRSGAAATGMENSGAYISGQGQLATDLAARFGQQRAELMNASSEAERQRAFQGSQSELDRTLTKYGMDLSSYTSRFNTTTQAGVQQMANAIQYDLGRRGIQIDQGKLEESIRNNTLGYNLGVGQQETNRYNIDQGTMVQLYKLFFENGQEALFERLFGKQAPPSNVGYVP